MSKDELDIIRGDTIAPLLPGAVTLPFPAPHSESNPNEECIIKAINRKNFHKLVILLEAMDIDFEVSEKDGLRLLTLRGDKKEVSFCFDLSSFRFKEVI